MMHTDVVPVLVISGVATAGVLVLTVAPRQVCHALFRVEPADWLSVFFARYLGLLVFAIGSLVVYSAFHAEIRQPVLVAAITEKAFFVGFIFSLRPQQRTTLALVAATADAIFALLYCAYLFAPG